MPASMDRGQHSYGQMLWQVSADMLGVTDFDGVWRAINPVWIKLLGWADDDVLGQPLEWLEHPDDQGRLRAALSAARDGIAISVQNRLRMASGEYRFLAWTLASAEGMVCWTGRDATQDWKREVALHDSQDFARLALSAVKGVGVWTYDVSIDCFFCDAAIAELYAIDPVQGAKGIRRSDFLANVHADDVVSLRSVMAGGLKRSGDLELEYRVVHPNGTIRWALSRGRTYFDDSGTPIRRTGVGIETTKQHLLEDQLRQAQKMEAVGQLTGGVAHDFNNLLTVIRGSVDLLRRSDLNEVRRTRYIDAIANTADRATKLTAQLLAFARRQALAPEIFDVGLGVTAIIEMIGSLVGARVHIDVRVPERRCFINADPTQFDTALVNIAVNARDAMNGEGSLTIAVTVETAIPATREKPAIDGRFVAIEIRDTGVGIPAKHLDQIFEPFFTTKGIGKGTGLGLSQVFGFSRQSGGEIRVESEPGNGTTFMLFFPEAVSLAPKSVVGAHQPALSGDGKCVLVVDDNPDVGEFVTEALESLGYRAVLVSDGYKALATLSDHRDRFDLVFTDVNMPGMGGVELGRTVQRLYGGLPVILTTGYSQELASDSSHGFELLQKPYSIKQLSDLLQEALGRTIR